jgi:hypothetical protein
VTCTHAEPRVARVCTHLLVPGNVSYHERFTGAGVASELVCRHCLAANAAADNVCAACERLAREGSWSGVAGTPEVIVAPSTLALTIEELAVPDLPALCDLQALLGADRSRWLGLTSDASLVEIDADTRSIRAVVRVAEWVDVVQPLVLHVSTDARFAAVANPHGTRGAIVELATGRVTMPIERENYHAEHSEFPLAFVSRGGRTLIVHSPAWNRLDISDAATGELLTRRDSPESRRGERSAHYLDYFHCSLAVSPHHHRIADAGWVWAPMGVVVAWSLDDWLDINVWESEDGPSRSSFCARDYHWNGPMCWLDDRRLAVWGYGADDEWLVAGVVIVDATTGAQERWFAGPPSGQLVHDGNLFAIEPGRVSVWNVAAGARLLEAAMPGQPRYHAGAKCFATASRGGALTIGRLGGHAASAAWNGGRVRDAARAIAAAGDFEALPVLGDALEAAGCDDAELLAHCRAPGPHGIACWALDRLLVARTP